ncbi:MAG TPA: hypothetical protein VGX25_25370 [Actinophytocola sp.]|uniref:hypothetical protein n=1 Tax=Actinophytocola sp. TaxID=1872138 RepID=UPI002DDD8CC0|nr:hypothetical protein [Actinophytocola sp.]HEV2782736.1 hypothetical protein [Actinophytocola sp.]
MTSQAGRRARQLLDEGVDQLRGQARDGQRKLAHGLRDLTDQLRQMSGRTDGSGLAADLVQQATERVDEAASWLESRDPGDLVDEIRQLARRRPGVFLTGAAVAGLLVGRLTRNMGTSSRRTGNPERPPGTAADVAQAPPAVVPDDGPASAAGSPATGSPGTGTVPS